MSIPSTSLLPFEPDRSQNASENRSRSNRQVSRDSPSLLSPTRRKQSPHTIFTMWQSTYHRTAMGQSPSIPAEYARLIFSTNNLHNSLIQCDALGLYYQLSTPMDGLIKNEHTTSFTRWDPKRGVDVVLAEWRQKQVGPDSIRLYFEQPLIYDGPIPGDGFIPVKQFFPRTGRASEFFRGVYLERTFTTSNGERYTWKSGDWSLKLYKEGSDTPIAEYVERSLVINKHNAYIRLAPGCEDILDYLVVTCIIAERKRLDAKRESIYLSRLSSTDLVTIIQSEKGEEARVGEQEEGEEGSEAFGQCHQTSMSPTTISNFRFLSYSQGSQTEGIPTTTDA